MKLLIVRHGQTVANLQSRIQGQTHGKLSKKGMLQSKKVAKMLEGSDIDIIFSSDLRRARQIASEITKHERVPTYYTKDLRARASGKYEGKRWGDVVSEIGPQKAYNDVRFKFGGDGESMMDVEKRLRKFIKSVMKNYRNQTVVICTHRHCVAVLLSIIFGVPLSSVMDHMKNVKNVQVVENSEIVKLLIEDRNVVYNGDNRNVLEIMSLRSHVNS